MFTFLACPVHICGLCKWIFSPLTATRDEEELAIPSVANGSAEIEKLLPNDPKRRSVEVDSFKKERRWFNPKLTENWNQEEGWNLDTQGSHIPIDSVHGQRTVADSDKVGALVAAAQKHTQAVSEGRARLD